MCCPAVATCCVAKQHLSVVLTNGWDCRDGFNLQARWWFVYMTKVVPKCWDELNAVLVAVKTTYFLRHCKQSCLSEKTDATVYI